MNNKLLLTAILIGFLLLLKNSTENFNSGYRHHKGYEFHKAMRSFGRTSHVAELNDAVRRECNPHGDFYTMRYNKPRNCPLVHSLPQFPRQAGYFNACGKKIVS